MAIENLYATSHIAGDFVNPTNAVGNTPTTWAGELNVNSNRTSRWAIGDPTQPLTGGATQTINVLARKGTNSGTPTITINLYENGVLVSSGSAQNVTNTTTGQTLSRTFTSGQISNRNNVEIEIVMVSAGGSPSVRNSAQVAQIHWAADVTAVTQVTRTHTTDAVLRYTRTHTTDAVKAPPPGPLGLGAQWAGQDVNQITATCAAPRADSVLYAFVVIQNASSTFEDGSLSGLSSSGWTKIGHRDHPTATNGALRAALFRTTTHGTSSGSLTWTGAITHRFLGLTVFDVTGVSAQVQWAGNHGTGTTGSWTLGSFANSSNRTLAVVVNQDDYTLGELGGNLTPFQSQDGVTATMAVAWKAGAETAPTITWSGSENWVGLATEVTFGQTRLHTTDAVLSATLTEEHTTDALLLAEVSLPHTTDVVVQATPVLTQTTDAVLQATETTNHTSDVVLSATLSVTHTTDAVLFVPSPLEEIEWIGQSSWAYGTSSPLTTTLPAHSDGDFVLLVVGNRTGPITPTLPGGITFTLLGRTRARTGGFPELYVYGAFVDAATTSIQVSTSDNVASGWFVQGAMWSGVSDEILDTGLRWTDHNLLTGDTQVPNSRSGTDGAEAVALAFSLDDNVLALLSGSEQGFTLIDTNAGASFTAFLMARKSLPDRGDITGPTIQQSTLGPDQWGMLGMLTLKPSGSVSHGPRLMSHDWADWGQVTTEETAPLGFRPQTDDLILVGLVTGSDSPPTITMDGYTQEAVVDRAGTHWLYLYRRFSTGTETSVVWTNSEGNWGQVLGIQVWRGVDQDVPFDVTNTENTGTTTATHVAPAITPVTDGAVVVSLAGVDAVTNFIQFSNAQGFRPSFIGREYLADLTGSGDKSIYGSDKLVDPAAATTAPTYEASVARNWVAITTALRPAPTAAEPDTVSHTTDVSLQGTLDEIHTTDVILSVTVTEDHTTDAVLIGTAGVAHTTDSILRATATTTHTTDVVLLVTLGETHTTDAALLATLAETHTTDAVLLATLTLTHTTDAFLLSAGMETHTTDASLLATLTETHTTDAVVALVATETHTTDAVLLATADEVHTTDALVVAVVDETHITDVVLQATATRIHTTDTLLQTGGTATHTTDATLLVTLSLTHTGDALLLALGEETHTTDVTISVAVMQAHQTEALLQATGSHGHATDVILSAAGIITHTTDAVVEVSNTADHTTDAVLETSFDVVTHSHTTDVHLVAKAQESHTTDAVTFSVLGVAHTTDVILQVTETTDHTTELVTVLRSTWAFGADAVVLHQGLEETHLTDAVVLATRADEHSTDVVVRATGTLTLTTDAVLSIGNTEDHTTDAHLLASGMVAHTSDARVVVPATRFLGDAVFETKRKNKVLTSRRRPTDVSSTE